MKRVVTIRGIEKPFSFLVKNGFTYNVAHRIINSKTDKLSIKHIEQLCFILNCTPNDLMEYTPNTKKGENKDHPLNQLIRKKRERKYKHLMRELPIDKLDKLEELLSKLDNKAENPEQSPENEGNINPPQQAHD